MTYNLFSHSPQIVLGMVFNVQWLFNDIFTADRVLGQEGGTEVLEFSYSDSVNHNLFVLRYTIEPLGKLSYRDKLSLSVKYE